MVQNTSTDANWTVCDGLNAPSRGGADGVGVTVIAGPLEDTGARAAALGRAGGAGRQRRRHLAVVGRQAQPD